MIFLERLSLAIFTTIILILSLILFGWIEASSIHYFIDYIAANPAATNITLGILVIFMLLAIKCIFFPSYSKEKEVIKKTTDIEVKEVTIKIKNIEETKAE